MPVLDFRPEAVEPGPRGGELGCDPLKFSDGPKELAAVGEFGRLNPVLCRGFELLEVRVAHTVIAGAGDLVDGVDGTPGFEHRADLHERQPRERQPEVRDGLLAGVERLCGDEVAPRGVGVVLVERLPGAGHVALHHFAGELVRAPVPLGEKRLQLPVRFLRPPGGNCLLSLSQRQPRRRGHG